jgi:hypothetical protein
MSDVERVDGEHLDQHIGRLLMFHRGRWYELLAVGPVVDGAVPVTVPAPRFNLLQHPNPPGGTMTMTVFDDDDYPVRDSPTDPAERQQLIAQGHHLVRSANDVVPRVAHQPPGGWHGKGRAVDLPVPDSVWRIFGDPRDRR